MLYGLSILIGTREAVLLFISVCLILRQSLTLAQAVQELIILSPVPRVLGFRRLLPCALTFEIVIFPKFFILRMTFADVRVFPCIYASIAFRISDFVLFHVPLF